MLKTVWLIIFIAVIMCISGCDSSIDIEKPEILDGPGMVYIDSDYRTDFANLLPFDEQEGYPFWAVAYMGSGEEGENNRGAFINTLFAEMTQERIGEIQHFDVGGDKWYLVVPRYNDFYDIMNGEEELIGTVYDGTPFTVCCDGNALIRYYGHGGSDFSPKTDGEKLICMDDVWDITEYIKNIM